MWPTEVVTTNRHADPAPWPIYRDGKDRLIDLVGSSSAEEVEQGIPLTPGWTVAEAIAHLCGLSADIAAGTRVGLGTPERTRHQVESRAGLSVSETCAEWITHSDAMQAAFDEDPFFGHRITADLTVHGQDIRHALGAAVDRDDPATHCAAHTYASVVTDLLLERTGVSLRVQLTDGTTFAPTSGADSADLTLRAPPFDFLRTVTGRRSHGEAVALDWDGDPTPILDALCPYGPLRDADAGL